MYELKVYGALYLDKFANKFADKFAMNPFFVNQKFILASMHTV